MPGDNPLLPAFPDLVFFGIIAIAVLAFIGGVIAVTVVVVRRANSGEPLVLQPLDVRHDPLMNEPFSNSPIAQQQQLLQQQQVLQEQLAQQQIQQQILNTIVDPH